MNKSNVFHMKANKHAISIVRGNQAMTVTKSNNTKETMKLGLSLAKSADIPTAEYRPHLKPSNGPTITGSLNWDGLYH